MTEPQLLKVKVGWLAMMPGDNWAVVGDTPEDALANWRAVVAQHIEIKARRNYGRMAPGSPGHGER